MARGHAAGEIRESLSVIRFDGFMSHENSSHSMDRDSLPADADGAGESGEVMAAIEDTGGRKRLVIADVSTDDSWLAASADASVSVAEAR